MEKILLTTRIRNGDRKAFDELCGRYYAMLVSYARLFMKDDWAEDVVQDVFYNVWQNRAALDDSNSLYKYLLRSVYNRALNYLDKNRRAGDYRAYYQERIASPSRTMSVLPLGAIASTERMLPGDAGATSPASVSEKNSSPAALPAIAATISTGRASM